MSSANLNIKVTTDAIQSVETFARLKREGKALKEGYEQATAAVAQAARALRANPGDAKLAKEFERLKNAARQAKSAFLDNQQATEGLRRSLREQGVSVRSLAADYARLRQAQAQTKNTSSPSMASGSRPTNSSVSTIDQDGLSRIEGSVDRLTKKIGLMGHVSAAVFAAQHHLLPYLGTLGRVSDEYAKFNAQLMLATKNGGDLAAAQADVARIARAAQSGIAETGSLYARLYASVNRLGLSQGEVAKVTETVALSLRVSGATAAESASAILQLSQAFGSGVLRGEEFNAVNEASPRLMQALADAIGVPRGELRGMAEQGQLTAKVLALALPKALGQLRAEAESMPQTIGGAFTNLRNEFTLLVGRIGEGTGGFARFAALVNGLADNLTTVLGAASAGLTAYFALWLGGIAKTRIAEAAANQARLAETARQAAAEAAGAATSAASASRVALGLRTVLSLLTGPVGIAVSVGLAAAAWLGFRDKGADALDAVIERQRKLLSLQNKTEPERKAATDPRTAELDAAEQVLSELKDRAASLRQKLDRMMRGGATEYFIAPVREDLARTTEALVLAQQGIAAERLKIRRDIEENVKAEAERDGLLKKALENAGVKTGSKGGFASMLDIEKEAISSQMKTILAELTKVHEAAANHVESIMKRRADAIERQARFEAELLSGLKANPGEATYADLDASMASARQAAVSGNPEDALKQVEAMRNVLLAMKEAGDASLAVLSGLAKEMSGIENMAIDRLEKKAESDRDAALGELIRMQAIARDLEAIKVGIDQAAAQAALKTTQDRLQAMADANPILQRIIVRADSEALIAYNDPYKRASGQKPDGFAAGGLITGPGSDTSDNILAWLSPGEFVVRADAVRRWGVAALSAINAGIAPRFAAGGLAGAAMNAMPARAEPHFPSLGRIDIGIDGSVHPVLATPDVADPLIRAARKLGRRP